MNEEEKNTTSQEEDRSEPESRKEFVEPRLERHEKLPDVTGFTF